MSLFETNNNLYRSIILAGGGVRLAYHAGVLMALEEEGLSFNHIDGTSGGIFGTAMMASGITPAEAAERWRKLKVSGFMSAFSLQKYFSQRSLPAIGSASGVRNNVFPALGIDIKKINGNTAMEATFNVCNFSKKKLEVISHRQVTTDHLAACISLPVFMPAVLINGDWYTDAVWIKDANLTRAVELGADDIWLVWCIGNTPEWLNGFFNQYVHMIEISANNGLMEELELINQLNTRRQQSGGTAVTIHIIKPEYPLPLDPDLFTGKINTGTLVDMGYADTKSYLVHKTLFTGKDPGGATRMKSLHTTVHFRQQFQGTIALGGRIRHLMVHLSFFAREHHQEYVVQLFTSVSTDAGNFTPGYNNQVSTDRKSVRCSFNYCLAGTVYHTNLDICFGNAAEFLAGLGPKTAFVTMAASGQTGTSSLYQLARNRIMNAMHLNIHSPAGFIRRMRTGHRILNYLFN